VASDRDIGPSIPADRPSTTSEGTMIKTRGRKFRLHVLETLEDRAVPSTQGATVPPTTTPPSPTTAQAELTQVEGEIAGAYAGFASGVYSDEMDFHSLPTLYQSFPFIYGVPPGSITSAGALLTAIDQEISTLEQAVTSAVQDSVSSYSLGLVQAQINGSTAGSLLSGVTEVLNAVAAASAQGYVPGATIPLIESAINGAISASYSSVTLDAYLYATGQGSAASSNLNLGKADGQINSAYGSVSTTITQAESTLYQYPTFGTSNPDEEISPTGQVTYTYFFTPPADESEAITAASNVVSVVDSQVDALGRAFGSIVSGTSVASKASMVRSQIDGTGSSSLLTQLNSLYAAAAYADGAIVQDGVIPIENVGVLVAAVDAAIAASYSSTAVETYLLATP
jgi:hypothetical protein